jgi:hypothetical protein
MARAINWTGSPTYRSEEVVAVPRSPLYKAYQLMHWGLMAVPLLAGLDKFANLTTKWTDYVAPQIGSMITSYTPFSVSQFMMGVGVVEILAALLVAVRPRIGGAVVGLWLAAIIANLLIGMHYFDVALRDFGLMVAAFGLSRLGRHFDHAHKLRADDDDVVDTERDVVVQRSTGTGRIWRHRDDDMV